MDEKRHVFHYNYKGYLMYYMMCLCVYFYIGGLAHPHGVLHGSGGPYAFVFFLFFCGCTPCRLFTSPFIHAYTPPFFAFICTIARPYSLRFIRIGTPRVRPPNCMAFAGSSSALVRTRSHYSGASVRAKKTPQGSNMPCKPRSTRGISGVCCGLSGYLLIRKRRKI
jgi:hypothetical protein